MRKLSSTYFGLLKKRYGKKSSTVVGEYNSSCGLVIPSQYIFSRNMWIMYIPGCTPAIVAADHLTRHLNICPDLSFKHHTAFRKTFREKNVKLDTYHQTWKIHFPLKKNIFSPKEFISWISWVSILSCKWVSSSRKSYKLLKKNVRSQLRQLIQLLLL